MDLSSGGIFEAVNKASGYSKHAGKNSWETARMDAVQIGSHLKASNEVASEGSGEPHSFIVESAGVEAKECEGLSNPVFQGL